MEKESLFFETDYLTSSERKEITCAAHRTYTKVSAGLEF